MPKEIVPTKLFVGNVAREVQASDLQHEFEQYGTIAECVVFSDYGFVVRLKAALSCVPLQISQLRVSDDVLK